MNPTEWADHIFNTAKERAQLRRAAREGRLATADGFQFGIDTPTHKCGVCGLRQPTRHAAEFCCTEDDN